MKKASMACLIAGALALPMAAFAEGNTSNAPRTDSGRSAGTVASDAAITAKVKTQLIKDRDVSAMNINVDTDNGVVTLRGNAKSRMEADKAASLARSVDGVKSVKNELMVSAASANTSRGSSTASGRADNNATKPLDSKPLPPKESQKERSPQEISD